MSTEKKKIIRVTTVPGSLKTLLKGQLKFMSQYYNVIGVSSSGEELEDVRQNEGVPTVAIEMTRVISPLRDLGATYRLYKLLKKEKPHIVHTHTPKAGIVGMLAAKLAGVEHRFHTIAGLPLLEATGFKRKLLNTVEKLTYSLSTRVLPNSFGQYDIILEEKFATKDKLEVIGKGSSNGINVNHFSISQVSDQVKQDLKKEHNIKDGDFVFIYVGRLVKDKGVNELIAAFNVFQKTNYNCKLLLVGPRENHLDPLLPETENSIANNKDIISVGWQKDVRPFMAISNLLVFPTYREGFPNVVMQACAMNLPCIVTDINGCNEIIEHNTNGLIIPTKNVNAVINAMQFFKDKPEEVKRMSDNARVKIVENYRHEYIWEELLKLYRKTEN